MMCVGKYIDDFLNKLVTPMSILGGKGRVIKAIFGVLYRVFLLYDTCRLSPLAASFTVLTRLALSTYKRCVLAARNHEL